MKTKPILATNLDDLLVKHEAFIEPHKAWFDRAIAKTGDKTLASWKGRKDYFLGVNQAMDKLMPKASKEKKTLQARIWYQEDVVKYIQDHPDCVNAHIAERLRQLKTRYRLVLVTSNTETYIDRILSSAGLTGIYDAIVASETEQEPNKVELVETLFERHGKPEYYLAGKDDPETRETFEKRDVKVLTVKQIDSI